MKATLVIIETKSDKYPVNSATLPEGWTVARLNKGLRNHLRARLAKDGEDISGLKHIGATSLAVGEIFG